MPDREKVIKGLECCIDRDYRADCYGCYQKRSGLPASCRDGLMADALVLLREQEPVEPIERNGFYYCGACRYALMTNHQKYCSDCGKKVKWDE